MDFDRDVLRQLMMRKVWIEPTLEVVLNLCEPLNERAHEVLWRDRIRGDKQ